MPTAQEFLASAAPTGSELVAGVVYLNDVSFEHQELCARMVLALHRWERDSGLGRGGIGGNWVLSDGDVYKPDVWWTSRPPSGSRHDGPPDLAIEVREMGTWAVDIGQKWRRYEAAGTAELWLVDGPARTVLVFRRDGDAFDTAIDVGPGEELTSRLLPGFVLAIDELFSDLP